MKVFVMVDMEGISGICQKSQVLTTGNHYQQGRRFLTWDVNACVEGCFDGGADSVTVRDAHGGGFHFIWDELDPRARYIQGMLPEKRMPDIERYDCLILLGYHAMAGTPRAVLEHTMSSLHWQNFWLDGKKAGEVAIDAAVAGDKGVPVAMVSGDDKVCAEAAALLRGVMTVEVKKGFDVEGAMLLSAEAAHRLIREGTAKAVDQYSAVKPYKINPPVEMRLELVSRGRVPYKSKDATIIDGRTYSVSSDSVEEALALL